MCNTLPFYGPAAFALTHFEALLLHSRTQVYNFFKLPEAPNAQEK